MNVKKKNFNKKYLPSFWERSKRGNPTLSNRYYVIMYLCALCLLQCNPSEYILKQDLKEIIKQIRRLIPAKKFEKQLAKYILEAINAYFSKVDVEYQSLDLTGDFQDGSTIVPTVDLKSGVIIRCLEEAGLFVEHYIPPNGEEKYYRVSSMAYHKLYD